MKVYETSLADKLFDATAAPAVRIQDQDRQMRDGIDAWQRLCCAHLRVRGCGLRGKRGHGATTIW